MNTTAKLILGITVLVAVFLIWNMREPTPPALATSATTGGTGAAGVAGGLLSGIGAAVSASAGASS